MAQTYGLDLEGYSQEHGYRGTVDFLRSMPDLALHTPLWGGPYILHLYAGSVHPEDLGCLLGFHSSSMSPWA